MLRGVFVGMLATAAAVATGLTLYQTQQASERPSVVLDRDAVDRAWQRSPGVRDPWGTFTLVIPSTQPHVHVGRYVGLPSSGLSVSLDFERDVVFGDRFDAEGATAVCSDGRRVISAFLHSGPLVEFRCVPTGNLAYR